MPKVSVVMSVYNGAKYIGEAIESVLAQTFGDWELIIADDGSIDNTAEIVAGFGDQVKYAKQPNRGISAARNLGLRQAQGEYVAFLDADDLWRNDFLSISVQQLDRLDQSFVGTCAGSVYVDHEGKEFVHTRRYHSGVLHLREILTLDWFPIHAALVRRGAIVEVGGFDEQLFGNEDWDLWLRLTTCGMGFLAFSTCLACYRLHGESNSRRVDTMRASRLRALEKLFDCAGLPRDIQEEKSRAFGRALVQSSAQFYRDRRDQEALCDFAEAIRYCPGLLDEGETYHAIICADQPVGYKGTGQMLDVLAGERRIRDALRQALTVLGDSGKWQGRASGKMYLALGCLAYAKREMKTARNYFFRAFRSYHALAISSDIVPLLAKSLLGANLTDTLKRLKRRIVGHAKS